MEQPTASNQNDDVEGEEKFEDSFDEIPFYDCSDAFDDDDFDLGSKPSSATTLRRRRSLSHRPGAGSADSPDPSSSVSVDHYSKERKLRFSTKVIESEKNSENLDKDKLETRSESLIDRVSEEKKEISTITNESNERIDDSVENVSGSREIEDTDSNLDKDKLETRSESLIDRVSEEKKELSTVTNESNERIDDSVGNVSGSREIEDTDSNFLLSLACLMIKAIGFQLNLFIYFVTFPIGLIHNSYMFVMDPFGVMRQCRKCVVRKLMRVWGFLCESISPVVYEWLKEHKSIWKLGLKCGWGFLWSVYVCIVLVGLLLAGFVIGGLVIRGLVEEPIRIKEPLNFDYTEKSPVAYLPLVESPEGDLGVGYMENMEFGKITGVRVIPPNHKLQVKVALTLPESDYNRNLGIFQVRLEFLAADGRTLASSWRPCMLKFRSSIIRLLLTFLKSAPLITGYASESQTLNVKFMGFTEGSTPTASLRVTIEQRAEFQHGAGIPEIYAASLKLESELPLLKRFVWYWKKTLFVWISMTIFTMELIFLLLCCKPLVIPRVRLRENPPGSNSRRDNPRPQRSMSR